MTQSLLAKPMPISTVNFVILPKNLIQIATAPPPKKDKRFSLGEK